MLKTCKCGKANNPTRKFCVRCGASLLEPIEEKVPERQTPSQSVQSSNRLKVPETKPAVSGKPPSPSTGDKWVRPSEVAKDRIRTSAPRIKSELEKAREAFARAEEVGIEEGTEGIVETRMLRASEVRELMDSAAEMARTAEVATEPEIPDTLDSAPMPTAPRIPTPDDIEQGILGSKSTIADRPGMESPKPSVPEPPAETAHPPQGIEITSSLIAKKVEAPVPPRPKEIMPQDRTPDVAKTPTISPQSQKLVPEVDALEMRIHDADYLDDVSISGTLTDLRNLYIELKQVNSDLEEIRNRLDAEVLNYRNASHVKRLRYEGLEAEVKLAKQEWNDAEKEHRIATDRRKKEISSREKRANEIEKRIKRGVEAVEKRVQELDKDKAKLAI